MVRPLRIQFPGAVYHIMSRGNERGAIFLDEEDRALFLFVFKEVIKRYNWKCYSYCLMPNHYHLIIETRDGNLSIGMRQLNGKYTQSFNKKHKRVGHLFQGRYKGILIDKDSYLLELCRYIVLNPVRAGLVKYPWEWRWSSCAGIVGKDKLPSHIDSVFLLEQFSKNHKQAMKAYCEFLIEGMGKIGEERNLNVGSIIGSKEFIDSMKLYIDGKRNNKEISRKDRFIDRPKIIDYFKGINEKAERNKCIYDVHIKYGYSLTEIGKSLGLHYSSISKIISKKHVESENSQFKT